MVIGWLKRAVEILESYQSVSEALKSMGLWTPLTTILSTGGVSLWAYSAHVHPVVILPIAIATAAGVFALGICLRIATQLRPIATVSDLSKNHITHRTFRLVDLVAEDRIIRNRTIENCVIYGPAVIIGMNSGINGFDKCTFLGSVESTQWEILPKPNTTIVDGVIGIEGTIFRNCRLINIAMVKVAKGATVNV